MIKALNLFQPIQKPTESAGLAGGQTEHKKKEEDLWKLWKKATDEQKLV